MPTVEKYTGMIKNKKKKKTVPNINIKHINIKYTEKIILFL